MNCPVNYEDPEEEEERDIPISSAAKMATWKPDIATTFKTPQECVGQNGNRKNKRQPHTWKCQQNTRNCQTCEGGAAGRSVTREAT